MERQPGSTTNDTFEDKVDEILNKAKNNAGSTGSAINISQIIACLGKEHLMGKRIGYGFSKRTLLKNQAVKAVFFDEHKTSGLYDEGVLLYMIYMY